MPVLRVAAEELLEEMLRRGGEVALRGRGRSMWPVIAPGDSVVVRRCDRPPVPGEIIVVRARIGLVTHRLVRRQPNPARLVTRGDWLSAEDPPLCEDALVGVVVRIVKRRATLDLTTVVGSCGQTLLAAGARLLNRPWLRAAVGGVRRRFSAERGRAAGARVDDGQVAAAGGWKGGVAEGLERGHVGKASRVEHGA